MEGKEPLYLYENGIRLAETTKEALGRHLARSVRRSFGLLYYDHYNSTMIIS